MLKKPARLWKIVVMILALWGFDVVFSKMTTNSQQANRDAKARQVADRRATEVMRQQILADSAAKFDQQQRDYGNNDVNYSSNQRYRNSASRSNNRNYQYSTSRSNNRNYQYSTSRSNNRNYQYSTNNQYSASRSNNQNYQQTNN